MSVVSMAVGATTPDGATFVAKVDGGGPVRVAVADNVTMTDPVFTSSQAVDVQGVAKVSITGLGPSTRHWWQTEDNGVLDTAVTGQLITHPAVGSQASFTVAVSGDAGLTPDFPGATGGELAPSRISNHPVFDTIRSRAVSNGWLANYDLGDLQYYDLGSDNHGIVGGGSLANYRAAYDDIMAQPRQHRLYREVSWLTVWDDHDFGPNDSDGTLPTKGNAAAVYRERVPHYPLDDTDGIWQEWQIGRVQFVALDVRYYRDPNSDPQGPSKTMLGAAQKMWLDTLLATSDAEALVLFTSSQWLHPTGTDTWSSFADERDELVQMLGDRGWLDRMVMVYADRHGAGITGGATNQWGGFPVMQAASRDASPSAPGNEDLFDVLEDTPGRNQYGTIAVTDLGAVITIELTAWRGTSELGSVQVGFTTSTPPPSFAGTITDVVSGSHRATFEARVLTRFQTGSDPDGTEIDIIDGSVTYDATAQVFATLELETSGIDERRRSRFPRIGSDLLAPYGHEVFVRRGVDVGSEIVWVPLGYFRLDDDEQLTASDGPIRMSAQDRMSGLIDGELIAPRQFAATRSVASVVTELVHDIYPSAVVLFDDDSGQQAIGRQILVDRDRYAALLDVAESLGKVMFWDGEGFLRIEDAPDPDDLVWDIKAGTDGVLGPANRRVSREGMANGVVALGEGGDTQTPVRAVAVDSGPNSSTRWFPPTDPDQLWFGQVPHFYSSPLVTTPAQARNAAAAQLRRRIGMPYNIQFSSVVNPSLRPREAVRVTHKDGTRERHLVDTVTIPLRSDRAMSGTTREQTAAQIAQVVPVAPSLISEG